MADPLVSMCAPFGAWPKDFYWDHIRPNSTQMISLNPLGRVDDFQQYGIVTKVYLGDSSPDDIERVCHIMRLAGDCLVPLVGRLFYSGNRLLAGFCMPKETPLDVTKIATKAERIAIIRQFRDTVAKLHDKNIVHGDIKPQNILLCSGGSVRLCDFDGSSIEGDGFMTTINTPPYISPFRARYDNVPMTRADDVYAMGLTIWEIYTGRTPLTYGDEFENMSDVMGDLLDRCLVGFLPDMELIDDPEIVALIGECLAGGRLYPRFSSPFAPNAIAVWTTLDYARRDWLNVVECITHKPLTSTLLSPQFPRNPAREKASNFS
ncbi:kinase-like domain-containing protein [Mycena rebaudengoi]|nr:kinase-like domain-containing protein [Mycena rebaudengoi]